MKGKEFVKKVLAGERDLSRIELEEGFDLNGYKDFEKMQAYLSKQELSRNSLSIAGSHLISLRANALFLPFVIADEANLKRANLYGANLNRAHLEGASLKYVKNLECAINLKNARFSETIVNPKERKIIEAALAKRILFVEE